MKSSQTKWLVAGLLGSVTSIAAIGFIGYFFILILGAAPIAETTVEATTEKSAALVVEPEQHPQRDEEHPADATVTQPEGTNLVETPVSSASTPRLKADEKHLASAKISGPEQRRRQDEKYLAEISAKNIAGRYETVAPHWKLFETLFTRHEFDAVEKELAAQLRQIRDPWKAMAYSRQIETLTHFGSGNDPEVFLRIAERWTQDRPDSHFAWMIRGGLLRAYAWYWRGTGMADTVTDEGWKKFGAALSDAAKCLEKSYALNPKDPEAPYQMLWVCIGADAPRAEFDKFFNLTVALVPTHVNAHLARQQQLFPKWGGSWPESDAFIQECVEKADRLHFPPLGTALFYGCEEMYYNREGYKEVFSRPEFADAMVANAKAELDASPDENVARANYARVLYRVDRYEDALAEFERLGDRFYAASMWDSAALYNSCRAFTYYHRGMGDPLGHGLEDFKRSVDLGVKFASPYYYLAIDRIGEQDYSKAETLLKKAIELEPEYAPAWVTLSSVYKILGRKKDQITLAKNSKQYDFDQSTRKHFDSILAGGH